MMLKVGHIFVKDGLTYTVLKIFDFDGVKVALMEIQKDKVDYEFFTISESADGGLDLEPILEPKLKNLLFENFIEGERINEE